MNAFIGMDTESSRAHGSLVRGRAAEISRVASTLSPVLMNASAWRGDDAERFRDHWAAIVAPGLAETAQELQRRADELTAHAEEQEQASTSDEGTAGASGGAGGGPLGAVSGQRPFAAGAIAPAAMAANFFSDDPDGSDGMDNGNGDDGSSAGSSGTTTDHTVTQEDADRIIEKYQVEDDELTTWELSGWKRTLAELAGVDIPDPVQATATEAEMLDKLGPIEMRDFNDAKNTAFSEVESRYGDENGQDPHPGEAPFNDDHADAFRHAYVNALNTRDVGVDWTTDFWTAHERIPANDPGREAMDLYNNEVGRRIATENPGASDDELADLVEQAVSDGEMVVIDENGRLVPSNAIAPAQAGHPDPDDAPLPGHPQERQTS